MRLARAEIDALLAARTTHRNTFQDDAVTFLRTRAETGGEYTLLPLVAEPGAGMLRNPFVTAWIMGLTDMRLPGVSRVAGPVVHAMADPVRTQGADRQLEERYCR
jgi:hypothetical protein